MRSHARLLPNLRLWQKKEALAGPQRQSWPTVEPAAGLLLLGWRLARAVEQERQFSGSARGFLPSVSPVWQKPPSAFLRSSVRAAISLSMTSTVRKLTWFTTKIPRSEKKKFKANGGNNWLLQVRESPLRHVMFPTQDSTTGQGRVVDTSVDEE